MKCYIHIGNQTLVGESFGVTYARSEPADLGRYDIQAIRGEFTVEIRYEPGAWLDLLCRPSGVTLNELVAALECRRWLTRGGPLASWYRTRPGWRVADAVETERN